MIVRSARMGFALLALTLPTSRALAQAPVPPDAIAAMEPIGWLAGRWSGEATIQGPDGPRTIRQSEDVKTALEGALLVVEGTGREGAEGAVVYRAFGVFSAGDGAGRYRVAAWQGGRFVDARAEIAVDGTVTWGFDTPDGGEVRYVIRRPEPDVWHEAGSFRAAGGDTWRPFMEMTLRREAEGAR
ncbi:MAG TPA: hypothetical protein VFS53_03885 [Gemmatimonadota bacterium]|nr:hypothetical protein [Gemmatimonadota bacterium]